MALLGISHTADDIQQSFLPAILPLLVVSYHLTLQAAGTLVLAQAISSSVVQPFIGYLADTRSMPWLIGVGLLLAGGGIALIGFTDSYTLMFWASLLSGLGVAMFHPEAARYANYVAGARKATGMRWFALGGNLGFAIGPVFATAALALYAQRGTWLAAVPCVVMAAVILLNVPRLRSFQPPPRPKTGTGSLPDRWGAFGILTAYSMLRSSVYVGVVAFIPLYFITRLGASQALGNIGLTLYLVSGAIGTLAGGPIADRFGRKTIMLLSTAGSALLLSGFVVFSHSIAIGYLVIAISGFTLVASNVALVVLGQEYLPNRMGIASGVTLGIAVSVGGMMSPVFGYLGDHWGLGAAFYAAAVMAAVATLVGFWLPPEGRGQHMAGKSIAASAA